MTDDGGEIKRFSQAGSSLIPFLWSSAEVARNQPSSFVSYLNRGETHSPGSASSVPSLYLSGERELENLGIGVHNTDRQANLSDFSSLRTFSS